MIYKEWSYAFKNFDILLDNLSLTNIKRQYFNTKTQSLQIVGENTYKYTCSFSINDSSKKHMVLGGIAQPVLGSHVTTKAAVTTQAYISSSAYDHGSVEIFFDTNGIKTISVGISQNSIITSSTMSRNQDYIIYCTEKGFFVNDDFFNHGDTDVMFNHDLMDDSKICLMDLSLEIKSLSEKVMEWCSR